MTDLGKVLFENKKTTKKDIEQGKKNVDYLLITVVAIVVSNSWNNLIQDFFQEKIKADNRLSIKLLYTIVLSLIGIWIIVKDVRHSMIA